MKKATKTIGLLALSIMISAFAYGQELKLCSTDEMVKQSLKEHPEFLKEFLAEQERLEKIDKEEFAKGYPSQQNRSVVYTIPIVFHILHLNGPENISDDQVKDEVRILNEDFSKTNADISQVVSTFQGITGNPQLQFVLAKKDNSGNCTNGIIRYYTSMTNTGNNTAISTTIANWPRNKYLNVVVVNAMASPGAAGYTYLPGTTSSSTDAIIILHDYIGSIGTGNATRSRALTHEVGHWFNLSHVWGNSNNPGVSCGDDGVSDTPVTEGWQSCNLTGNTCGGGVDNVQNFLEYSYCSKMFSAGQATRVQNAAASSTAQRSSLWTTTNLAATGVSGTPPLCKADFKSSSASNTVCQGGSLTFTDLSWNGTPTSWSWTFQGGTPGTSTAQSPSVQYNTPGKYTVTLTASNSTGSVTATKTSFITVYATPGQSGALVEGFEGGAIPNTIWEVNNPNSSTATWAQTTVAAATGTKSARIANSSSIKGQIDELISLPINMATVGSNPKITFKVAHAPKLTSADTAHDVLSVLVSTNCGLTWSQRAIYKDATLTNGTPNLASGSYTPTSTQWASKSINLTGAFASANNLIVMFRFTSDGGNNVYIDDINIAGTLGTVDLFEEGLGYNVFPNPVENNSVVTFSLDEKQAVDLTITDVLGKNVTTMFNGELAAGDYQYPINQNTMLSSGVYFVRLSVNHRVFTKKLVVK